MKIEKEHRHKLIQRKVTNLRVPADTDYADI